MSSITSSSQRYVVPDKNKNIFNTTDTVQGSTATKESDKIEKMRPHEKPNAYSSRLHFGSCTESDESIEVDAKFFEEKYLIDYEIISIDDSTIKILYKIHFQSKVVQFISSYIPIFYAKSLKIQEVCYVIP